MIKLGMLIALGSLLTPGCTSIGGPAAQYARFTAETNALGPDELMAELTTVSDRYSAQPSDADRMRLSFLLSRPALPNQDLDASGALLSEVDPGGAYATVRELALREVQLLIALRTARLEVEELQRQLRSLKAIEADLIDRREQQRE